jgi:hypothetical protein
MCRHIVLIGKHKPAGQSHGIIRVCAENRQMFGAMRQFGEIIAS